MQILQARMRARSRVMVRSIEGAIPRLMIGWLVIGIAACALRVAVSPSRGTGPDVATLLPYVLVIGAPILSLFFALRWFEGADRLAPPAFRLARIGRWRSIPEGEARRHKLYGASGLMVPLLVGMLINVPLRTAEFLAAMPALSGSVPEWLRTLNLLMTADVVLLSSLYVVAFVAGLRRLPTFPRLLGMVWLVDLSIQALIAAIAAVEPGLPADVATALDGLLRANLLKAGASIAIWLPYLLLSKRVNVTFRHRVSA